MREKRYILALDEGTTSARAVVFDVIENRFISIISKPFKQIYPESGYVEHDPIDILAAQFSALDEAVILSKIDLNEIYGIGITNQRETALMWDSETGKPVYNAIVWQCRRTSKYCEQLIADGASEFVRTKTGLKLDAYFSASKYKWILENVPEAGELLKKGRLRAGTIDSFLAFKLTGGKRHVTDVSNASRTMLMNIETLDWDDDLLNLFKIPREILPEIIACDEIVGTCNILGKEIPVCGIAGDQQAALFGQTCFKNGMAKNTYGTGCFILMNTGSEVVLSNKNILATVAWKTREGLCYALEGSVFNAGSTVQWLRDEMQLIKKAEDTERYANRVSDTLGVYLVPAFTGLGCPYWDMDARGTIIGLTRGANKYHIVRAGIESMAYATCDILRDMQKNSGICLTELRCDGGASRNNFLMQFQSDILGATITRPLETETTVLGSVYLSGLGTGAFQSEEDLIGKWKSERQFTPQMTEELAAKKYCGWLDAVKRTRS